MLAEISDLEAGPQGTRFFACVGLSGNDLQKRAFSCAVNSNQSDFIETLDEPADTREHPFGASVACRPFLVESSHFEHIVTAARWYVELEFDRFLFGRNLGAIDLREFLDSGLHLCGVACARCKLGNEFFFFGEHFLLNLSETANFILKQFCTIWRFLDEQLKNINKQLELHAQKESKLEEVYRSFPGIGPVTSRVLANELGDMSQFKSEDCLFSFVGLTPTENSSGDSTRKGHISRQGNSRIRHALAEIAWRAIGQDEALRSIYDRISGRAGGKRAIVAVARRIIGRIRACFATTETWKLNFQLNN